MNESKERKTSNKVKKIIHVARKDERDDQKEYRQGIKVARKAGDKQAVRVLTGNLKDEIDHEKRLNKLDKRYLKRR
jgi:ferritin-like metal-binding protein YciE